MLVTVKQPGGVDARTRCYILELVRALSRRGVGILGGTHDSDGARVAERVLRFRDGRLIADETQNAADAATALVALPEADAVA